MDDRDPVMEMYEAQAIVIEKEAVIEDLRRRIEEFERERQERNQREPSSSSREAWATISTIAERLEESMRNIQGSMEGIETQKLEETEIIKIMHDRVTALEEKYRFDRIERRLDEIVVKLDKIGAENVQNGMKELKGTNANILERMTTLEDRIKGSDETILIMGGKRGYEDLNEMVILDMKSSTWKVLDLKLPCKNSDGGSAVLNDEIYIFGGTGLKKKLYKLDSQQIRWIELAEMNEDRQNISNSSLAFQGCIWVCGGWKKNTFEKYSPERNEWIKMPGMNQKRNAGAAAVCNEKIFVSGGHNGRTTLRSVECFDPTSGVWTPMVDMPDDRNGHSMISDDSSLFIMGGWDGKSNIKTVWRIRPSKENAAWEELQPMNEPRRYFTAKSLCCSTPDYKKEIYAISAWNGKKSLDGVEIFDGEKWRKGPNLPKTCDSTSSVVISPSLAETLLQYRK